MKTILTISIVGVFAFSLIGCKKDYTCTCTLPGAASTSVTYEKVKKSDAEDACSAANTSAAIAGGSCKLD